MAVIEHRDIASVLEAFESTGLTKFALWQGNTPCMVYDGDDPVEALNKLEQWLQFIQDGGTSAIYKLRVYPDTAKDITNKTAFKAETRLQLNAQARDGYQSTPDGKVMIFRDGGRQAVGNTQNPMLQQLLDTQNKTLELLTKILQNKDEERWGKIIGALNTRTPDDTMTDKIIELGKAVIDRPDIIDRIGYIIRPSAYTREPVAEPISGTQKQEEPMATETVEKKELTEEEVKGLEDRLDTAMNEIEDLIGLERLVDIIEALASQKPEKIEKLTPDKLKSAFSFL